MTIFTAFMATFIVLLIVVLAMALGVMMGRSSITGSCGGLNQAGLDGSCSGACRNQKQCKRRQAEQQPSV